MSIMVAVLTYAMAIFVNVHLVGKWVTTNLIAVQWKQKWWHNAILIKWKFWWTDVFWRTTMSTVPRQAFLIRSLIGQISLQIWLVERVGKAFLDGKWKLSIWANGKWPGGQDDLRIRRMWNDLELRRKSNRLLCKLFYNVLSWLRNDDVMMA